MTGVMVNSSGHQHVIQTDDVVLAAGVVPNRRLAEELNDKVTVIHPVGDCHEGRRIIDAVKDGYRIGREI